MNPLTLVKRIQSINAKEADLGISDQASWHAKYKDSAYVFVGGIPYDLTEGDLLAVFAQYGEIVDVNLVRDKASGKSKGFAFVAYEDQRSTILAVDNLNGAQIAGRTIRVDHAANYKKKEEEDEETERQKREERGVCRAFQKGECKYGDACKYSHDAQRAANTGWGTEEERRSRQAHNKFDKHLGDDKKSLNAPLNRSAEKKQVDAYEGHRGKNTTATGRKHNEVGSVDQDSGVKAKRLDSKDDRGNRTAERRSSQYEPESKRRDDFDGREQKRPRRHDIESTERVARDDRDRDRDRGRDGARDGEKEKRSSYSRDYSPQHRRDKEDDHRRARRDEDYSKSRR